MRRGRVNRICYQPTNRPSVRPFVRPSTRTCSQRKKRQKKNKLYLLEEVPPILGKAPSRKRHAKQNRSRNLPPTALPRIHREYPNVDHPTDRPTDRYPISSLFFPCLIHSSIIHPSSLYLPTIIKDNWPPDSVASKGPTHSVRGSVTTRRKERREESGLSALVCRLHNGGLHQDGSVLRFGGREGK